MPGFALAQTKPHDWYGWKLVRLSWANSYDAFGRRVRKVVSGVATVYHYDVAGNLIAETTAGGTPLRDIVYMNGERVAMKLYGSQMGGISLSMIISVRLRKSLMLLALWCGQAFTCPLARRGRIRLP